MNKRDFRLVDDLNKDELSSLFELTLQMKTQPERFTTCLAGKTMAMINEKQSLRTKVTFEAGIQQMGGFSVYLTNHDINLGKREPVKDIARNLSRWVDIIVARVYQQSTITEMADYADIPVINALSDADHPCQAVADLFTLWDFVRQHKSLNHFNLTYVGDGNNVCNSLIRIAALTGVNLTVSTPAGYEPDSALMERSRDNGASVTYERDPQKAVASADAIYTDVWASMGQEKEAEQRKQDFANYQVNDALLGFAPSHAVIMHCLPAHRGEEITDEVLESPRSIVFEQAENRLHGQKALMYFLLTGKTKI
ncbi:MAG: ornithine carbamoyltransferase [Candidatus Omnitrophota bacterium]|nr:MAG: ornithine carbamoyltransferase [Candidatus Omnitrophota bacterium]